MARPHIEPYVELNAEYKQGSLGETKLFNDIFDTKIIEITFINISKRLNNRSPPVNKGINPTLKMNEII